MTNSVIWISNVTSYLLVSLENVVLIPIYPKELFPGQKHQLWGQRIFKK